MFWIELPKENVLVPGGEGERRGTNKDGSVGAHLPCVSCHGVCSGDGCPTADPLEWNSEPGHPVLCSLVMASWPLVKSEPGHL